MQRAKNNQDTTEEEQGKKTCSMGYQELFLKKLLKQCCTGTRTDKWTNGMKWRAHYHLYAYMDNWFLTKVPRPFNEKCQLETRYPHGKEWLWIFML